MAVLKLSQIANSPADFVAADTLVGVHGGNTDYQFSGTQLLNFINANGSTPPSGPAGGDLAGTYPNPTLNTSISTHVAFSNLNNTTISGNAAYAVTLTNSLAGNTVAKQYHSNANGFAGTDIYAANGSSYKGAFGYGNSGSGSPWADTMYIDTNGVDFKIFGVGSGVNAVQVLQSGPIILGNASIATRKVQIFAGTSALYALEVVAASAGGSPAKQYNSSAAGFAGIDLYEANGTTFVGTFGYGNSGSGAPYANNVYVIGANKDFVVFGGGSGSTETLRVTNAGALTTNIASFILGSKTTITGGSTGNIPTLTAGPVTGNPTKWLPYDDNGTTRYIPSW